MNTSLLNQKKQLEAQYNTEINNLKSNYELQISELKSRFVKDYQIGIKSTRDDTINTYEQIAKDKINSLISEVKSQTKTQLSQNEIMDKIYSSKLDEITSILSGKSEYLQKIIKSMVQKRVADKLKQKEIEYVRYLNKSIQNTKDKINLEWNEKYNKLKMENNELITLLRNYQSDLTNSLLINYNSEQSNIMLKSIDDYYTEKLKATQRNNSLVIENIERQYKSYYDKKLSELEVEKNIELEREKQKLIELQQFYKNQIETSKIEDNEDETKSIIKSYENKINQLFSDIQKSENEKTKLNEQISQLSTENDNLKELEKQNSTLQLSLANKMIEIEKYKEKEIDYENKLKELKDEYNKSLYDLKVELRKQKNNELFNDTHNQSKSIQFSTSLSPIKNESSISYNKTNSQFTT